MVTQIPIPLSARLAIRIPNSNLMAHTGTFQLEYIPMDNLTLRGGYRLQYQHINGDNYVDNILQRGQASKQQYELAQWMGCLCRIGNLIRS